jgi:hypothetical protein
VELTIEVLAYDGSDVDISPNTPNATLQGGADSRS